ncbi:hypothetical protein P171DRAFT_102067 [Karstenula rhodostoma CBS 690.94]|uniref:Uncharacterized protein n=1 Tax=Karstenula rhodostoma CBS 690.94 TaxID=1392251 RepID=A0A9P4PCE0_9PLEO|nr:hypothetical protein P171DRAFT_102067 [Karstenula rhodostoma CBS 690.94]
MDEQRAIATTRPPVTKGQGLRWAARREHTENTQRTRQRAPSRMGRVEQKREPLVHARVSPSAPTNRPTSRPALTRQLRMALLRFHRRPLQSPSARLVPVLSATPICTTRAGQPRSLWCWQHCL